MKIVLSIYFLFLSLILLAQQERGANVVSNNYKNTTTATTRVLIVGISQYAKLSAEKQLEYADDDAFAFYTLLNNRPDLVAPQNIVALFNEDATDKNKILSILSTYHNESKKGDKIIVYFAGHGDLQNVFGQDNGFLLLHNVSADGDYYASDAIRIDDLNRFMQGSAQKDVSVFLITDACRSGKLISTNENSKRVLSALSQEYDKVFKLVSCQANQVSFEGKQWGNGHGVFSYYFINGLKGLADRNNDQFVSFGELSRYVINNVLDDTNDKQEPEKSGNSDYLLLSVNKNISLEAKKDIKQNKKQINSTTVSRGLDKNTYFYDLDPTSKILVDEFAKTIHHNKLLKTNSYSVDEVLFSNITKIEIGEREMLKSINKTDYCTGFTNSGNQILIGGDKVITCYNSKTNKYIQEFKHKGCRTISVDPRGKHFASGGWNQKINIWNIKSGQLKTSFFSHGDDIRVVKYSSSGRFIASGGDDRSLKIWGTDNWEDISKQTMRHDGTINDLVIFDLDKKILTVDNANNISIWDINTAICEKKYKHSSEITTIKLNRTEKEIITGDKSGNLIIWDISTLKPKSVISTGLSVISTIEITDDMRFVFVADRSRRLLLFDTKTKKKLQLFNVDSSITGIAMDNNSRWISVSMYGGWGYKLDLSCNKDRVNLYADDLYIDLLNNKKLTYLHTRLTSYYTIALMSKVKVVVDKFLNEQAISSRDLNICEQYVDKAIEINRGNKFISDRLEIDKKLLDSYKLLMQSDFSSYKRAIKLIDDIKEQMPDASFTHNTLCSFYTKLNELDNAKIAVQSAIKQIPTWTKPKINLGKTYYKEGEYLKAINEFDIVLNSNPNSVGACKNKADVLTFLGQFNEAEKLYKKALKNDSSYVNAMENISKLYVIKDEFGSAESYIKKAISVDSANATLWVSYAKIKRLKFIDRKNKINRASLNLISTGFQYLEKAKGLNPNNISINLELGYYYLTLNSYSNDVQSILENQFPTFNIDVRDYRASLSAIKHFNNVINSDPFLFEAYMGLGSAYIASGDNKKAKQFFSDLIKKFPKQPQVYYYMSNYLNSIDETKKATKYSQKAIRMDGDYIPAFYSYSKLLKPGRELKLDKEIEEYSYFKTDLFKRHERGSRCYYLEYEN